MSTIKVNSIQNTSGVEVYTAKAWVHFNGNGTVAIKASGNVSSITDVGVGTYTVNFTTPFPDVNYAASGTAGNANGVACYMTGYAPNAPTTTSFTLYAIQGNTSAAVDVSYISAAFFR